MMNPLDPLSHRPAALIAVQCMAGLSAGTFGVVGVLIVADLTKGTGYLAKRLGDNVTFLVPAGIALTGLVFFWLLMPETRIEKADRCPA